MLNYNFTVSENNKNIILPLNQDLDFIGDTNFINESNLKSNDLIDQEISKYTLSNNVYFMFYFFNNIYQNNFISAGFTENEINLSNKGYRYSYILYQVYDSFKSNNQILLHNGYIPIYLFPNRTISYFNIILNKKYYEFNNLYIPNNFNLSDNDTLYVNFKFYNAKTGKLSIFYNQSINVNSEEKLYFKITINKENKTYIFNNETLGIYQYLNEEFINKINERNVNENKSPIYKSGNLFDINGEYI